MGGKCKCGRLRPEAFGIALGILSGLWMMLFAWWAWHCSCANLLTIIQQWSSIYPGLDATLMGGLIGGAWGLLQGFIFGFLVAWVYNLFSCCAAGSCCCEK